MLIMSRIEFHSAHFSEFMNHGPSPTTTLDSHETYSNGLKRQMYQDIRWLLPRVEAPYWLLLLSLGLSRDNNPESQNTLHFRPFKMHSFLHWSLNQFYSILYFFVQLIFFVFNHETLLYRFHSLKNLCDTLADPPQKKKTTCAFQHLYYFDLWSLFIWFSVLQFLSSRWKNRNQFFELYCI